MSKITTLNDTLTWIQENHDALQFTDNELAHYYSMLHSSLIAAALLSKTVKNKTIQSAQWELASSILGTVTLLGLDNIIDFKSFPFLNVELPNEKKSARKKE